MRVLIIGGTGIISTGITRLLVERGDEVVLYNRGRRKSLWLQGATRSSLATAGTLQPLKNKWPQPGISTA